MLFDASINSWLKQKTSEEREFFVNTIYELFASTDIDDWYEFSEKRMKNLSHIINNTSKLDVESKQFIVKTFAALAFSLKDETLKNLPKPPQKVRRKKETEDEN